MPTDWNDTDSRKQFYIRARNEGWSDDEIITYSKKKRASLAGQTLQKESAFKLQQSRPILSAGAADVLPPGKYQEVLPYILNAPGQAMKEGIDKLQAMGEGTEGPSLKGAVARTAAVALAPKAVSLAARGLSKSVGIGAEAFQRITRSSPVEAAKILYGKLAKGEAGQLGSTIATKTGAALNRMQPSALAKDAYVEGLNAQGKAIPVEGLAQAFKNAIPEEATFGSDVLKQARTRLDELGDELLSKRVDGKIGIGDFVTFKDNIKQQLLKATNPVLRQRLGALAAQADDYISQTLGPAVGNQIKTLEAATANRLNVLRKVNRFFRINPEKAAEKVVKSEEMMRAVRELGEQTGIDYADDLTALAAKKTLHPTERSRIAELMTRLAGSSVLAHFNGPVGFMAFIATSPGARRQAAKLSMLLSTTEAPQAAAAAAANATSE